jgi:rubrerythrin
MDFYDFAKEIETEGRKHYLKVADMIGDRELSTIFKFLAMEEKRHYEFFDALQRNADRSSVSIELLVSDSKNVFKAMTETFLTGHIITPGNYSQVYEQALRFENKSIELYEDALSKMDDDETRSALKIIIGQEKVHADFIRSLMGFLRYPGEWLENAEFHHAEEF